MGPWKWQCRGDHPLRLTTTLAAAEEATGTMTGAPEASEEVPVASIEAPAVQGRRF